MEKVTIPCLKAVNDGLTRHKLIPLDKHEEVIIGRSEDVAFCIPSTMISRKHAIFKKNEKGQWNVKDNGSLNGTFINDKRIPKQELHMLKDGDVIRLGVATAPDKEPEFVWKFFTRLKMKRMKILSNDSDNSQSNSQCRVLTQPVKRTREQDENKPGCSDLSPKKRQKIQPPAPTWSPTLAFKQKMEEKEREARQKLEEQERQLAEMKKLLEEKEEVQGKLMEEMKEKEEKMKEELKKQQEALADEKKKMEEEMKLTYEQQIQDKETSLLDKLTSERQRLLSEKQRIEDSLKKEMENKLEEKDKELEKNLLQEKEKLEKVIANKELEHKMVETELNAVKSEHSKEKEEILKTKESLLTNIEELMESELQCTICSELFIQATSLECSHSFCAYCLEKWMKLKKECPVCRAAIKSHFRSRVLDSYIDSMIIHLSDEMKERRKTMIEERRAEQEQLDKSKKPRSPARGRGRGRGGASTSTSARTPSPATRMRTRAAASAMEVGAEVEVEISSDSDEEEMDSDDPYHYRFQGRYRGDSDEYYAARRYGSDDDDDDDDDGVNSSESEEGIGDVYYGGYGRCYNCGRRGHWANGCPN